MPRGKPTSSVISLGSAKEAALYFEHVFPIDFGFPMWAKQFSKYSENKDASFEELWNLEVPFSEGFDDSVLESLLPEKRLSYRAYLDLFAVSMCFWGLPMIRGDFDSATPPEGEREQRFRSIYRRAGLEYDEAVKWAMSTNSFNLGDFVSKNISRYNEILDSIGLLRAPTWHGAFEFMREHLGDGQSRAAEKADYAVAIRDLHLIDVTRVSWEAIVELRKDANSAQALRAFRLFFNENFAGKDADYVSDKLANLLYEYEATAKFWGFETARKSIAVAVSQQTLAASALGALASAAAGAPIAVAASAGAVVTLSNCLLEFGQIYVDTKKGDLQRPLRYLTRLKAIASK